MQRVLVTGLNGRLAPFLKTELETHDICVIPFDRQQLDINDQQQQLDFIISEQIDAICHLATGPEQWVTTLAGIAYSKNLPFLFTSTESVFNPASTGPFYPDHPADATSDYGVYKIACEQAALAANPSAIIARLGWQMFKNVDTDNLLTHVRDMHAEKGFLVASTQWRPAVAYVGHTMACLRQLLAAGNSGIYHVGGNEDGLSFYDLVVRINDHFKLGWDIRPGGDPDRDGRIIDNRVPCPMITEALS